MGRKPRPGPSCGRPSASRWSTTRSPRPCLRFPVLSCQACCRVVWFSDAGGCPPSPCRHAHAIGSHSGLLVPRCPTDADWSRARSLHLHAKKPGFIANTGAMRVLLCWPACMVHFLPCLFLLMCRQHKRFSCARATRCIFLEV